MESSLTDLAFFTAIQPQLLCNLYATLGTVHQQSKHTREAESWNKKELAMARQHQFKDSQSRALGNLGRIYVQQAQYTEGRQAIAFRLLLKLMPNLILQFVSRQVLGGETRIGGGSPGA